MILILDTSSSKMQVILCQKDGKFTCCSDVFDKHQKHLLPQIEKLLASQNTTIDKVDGYAVVIGPGSFTGIRLAVATAKGFGQIMNRKVLPINMLDLLSFKLSNKAKEGYAVFVKCTSSRVYMGCKQNGEYISKTLDNSDAIDYVTSHNLQPFGFDMDKIGDYQISLLSLEAKDYVDYVLSKSAQDYLPAQKVEPLYMALSQAEEELIKRQNKEGAK